MMDEVLYEVADRVAVITINRPNKHNALNAAVRQGLWEAWRRFEADADARVAILTGAGEKAFCAGMDLAEMSEAKRGVPPPDLMPDLGRNIGRQVGPPVVHRQDDPLDGQHGVEVITHEVQGR